MPTRAKRPGLRLVTSSKPSDTSTPTPVVRRICRGALPTLCSPKPKMARPPLGTGVYGSIHPTVATPSLSFRVWLPIRGGGYRAYLCPHRRTPMARMGISCRTLHPLHSRTHPLLRRKRQARAVRTNTLGACRLLCGGHPCAQAERYQRLSGSTERR